MDVLGVPLFFWKHPDVTPTRDPSRGGFLGCHVFIFCVPKGTVLIGYLYSCYFFNIDCISILCAMKNTLVVPLGYMLGMTPTQLCVFIFVDHEIRKPIAKQPV